MHEVLGKLAVDEHQSLTAGRSGPEAEGRPWKTAENVELAALSWVHWHNNCRPQGYFEEIPPARVRENALHYETGQTDPGRI